MPLGSVVKGTIPSTKPDHKKGSGFSPGKCYAVISLFSQINFIALFLLQQF